MIAIHFEQGNNFSVRWKEYLEENNLKYKVVSCYDNDILEQLEGCSALLWNVDNYNYRDQLMAKYLIQSLTNRDIKVFPDNHTVWHFDDKVAQKYLFNSINAELVKTYVFYEKQKALHWLTKTTYPKVFKLRNGSGAKNVILVKSEFQAKKLVKKAFGSGFSSIDMVSILKERYRKFRLGKEPFIGVLKGIVRVFIGTPYKNMTSKEKGYIYFQEFLPNNEFDQRIIVIGKRAFALKRMVRKDDFRASGSGNFIFDRNEFDIECIRMAFDINKKLKFQCMAYDFMYDEHKNIKIGEVSYTFNPPVYDNCPGYWDENLNWHEGKVKFQDWILEDILNEI